MYFFDTTNKADITPHANEIKKSEKKIKKLQKSKKRFPTKKI